MKDRNDVINNYVTDMHGVEKHILEAVERQLGEDTTSKYPEAVRVITSLKTTLQNHVRSLEQYNEKTNDGGVKEAVKEAVTSALGVAAGLYDQIRDTDQVSRMLRDDYTATSLAAISYHMLYTSALALKADELAQLALRNLKDLTPILVDISKAICVVVAAEMADQDKAIDASVGAQAVRATQEAWSHEQVEG
ncbi:hypothetical protein RQM47_13590 [Rubrivirga sp. S365]|uniref:Ferritin-like metal-binding protein YciE n=1 Tax=Rubrivirga litoralis TaxID=3075598 RepID=A0ABU3BMV6_9BACT|nr:MULTISPECIES: hypothetical protein [unclassified Rubrivirga]MDT0630607.1 hypothetical protein [Rubrivirga sp. F394]MDT7857680.1 hypothetical protein [Rubrivirga sp. S365]